MESARVNSISIISYFKSAKYVKFLLRIQGKTRFLHSLCDSEAPEFLKSSRYSKLLYFHNSLVASNPNIRFPKFPPKSYINNKSEEFLRLRIDKLNRYLEQVMQIPSVQSSEEVFKLVSPKKAYSIALLGSETIDFKAVSSIVMDRVDNVFASSPRASVFESNFCIVPIDIIVKNKLKRVNNLVCASECNNISELHQLCDSVDLVGILYIEGDQISQSVAWQIENKIQRTVPRLVMALTFDSSEHILELVKDLLRVQEKQY